MNDDVLDLFEMRSDFPIFDDESDSTAGMPVEDFLHSLAILCLI